MRDFDVLDDPVVGASLEKTIFIKHIVEVVAEFNSAFKRVGLPVQMNCKWIDNDDFVDRLLDNEHIRQFIQARIDGENISGVMYPTQINTVVDVFRSMWSDPGLCILILGAMQCGKTGTACAAHLAGPLFFLLTGGERKYYPIMQGTHRVGHNKQTEDHFDRWSSLYRNLVFEVVPNRGVPAWPSSFKLRNGGIDLALYNREVLHDALRSHLKKLPGDIFSHMFGRQKKNILTVQECCVQAKNDGFSVLFLNDEPHWGSQKAGVQDQMMMKVKKDLQNISENHIFIALDATPFQVTNCEIAKVNHRLAPNYCGPNFWLGEPLDDKVQTKSVQIMTAKEFEEEVDIKDFGTISRKCYVNAWAFKKAKNKKNDDTFADFGSWTDYRERVNKALRKMIHHVLLDKQIGRGIFLRFLSRNDGSDNLETELNLDKRIQVIPYYGISAKEDLKTTILRRCPNGEPYVVLVTAAARMADEVLNDCVYFFDFTDTIGDQTALLQGTYGRACGYNKNSVVVMNERSIGFVRAYHDSKGEIVMRPNNRTSTSPVKAGAPTVNARLAITAVEHQTDPVIRRIFAELQKRVVDHIPFEEEGGLVKARNEYVKQQPAATKGFIPIWEIIDERTLRYLESNAKKLFPELYVPPTFLRKGVEVKSRKGISMYLDVLPENPKYGHFGIRDITEFLDKDSTSEGMRPKGKYFIIPASRTGDDRVDDRAKDSGRVQPQLWMYRDRKAKKWVLDVIVLRMKEALRMKRDYGIPLPMDNDLHDDFLSPDKKDMRQKRILDAEKLREERRRDREKRRNVNNGRRPRA